MRHKVTSVKALSANRFFVLFSFANKQNHSLHDIIFAIARVIWKLIQIPMETTLFFDYMVSEENYPRIH